MGEKALIWDGGSKYPHLRELLKTPGARRDGKREKLLLRVKQE